MRFYHLTAPEDLEKILKEGIRAIEGNIFLFDSDEMSYPYEGSDFIIIPDWIARNQYGLEKYCVLAIDDAGITGEMLPDSRGEVTSPAQWVLKQALIRPEFIFDYWDDAYYK